MEIIADYKVTARNDANAAENRIHGDEIAAKYGFRGGLVPGVTVFGYLSHPLVEQFGRQWLVNNVVETRFLKPAFEGDELLITSRHIEGDDHAGHIETLAHNQNGELLAFLRSRQSSTQQPVSPLAAQRRQSAPEGRPEISWDAIVIDEPYGDYRFTLSEQENRVRAEFLGDGLSCYQSSDGLLHPYFLLDACNQVMKRRYFMPAWIHTGSKLVLREPLLVGKEIEIRAVPTRKWETKGHQLFTVYQSFWQQDRLALEVDHTAIFRIAS